MMRDLFEDDIVPDKILNAFANVDWEIMFDT